MGFDPIVRNTMVCLRCYNAVRVELTTRTALVAIRMIVTVTEGGGSLLVQVAVLLA